MRMSSINGEMSVAIFDDQREISVTDEANVLEKQSSKFRRVPSYLKASEVLVPIARYVAWDVYHLTLLVMPVGVNTTCCLFEPCFLGLAYEHIWEYHGISWSKHFQTPKFHGSMLNSTGVTRFSRLRFFLGADIVLSLATDGK